MQDSEHINTEQDKRTAVWKCHSPASRIKNVLLFTGAQCSFFIGAGIATGQESLQYFTAHGWWGIVAIIIVVLLFSMAVVITDRMGPEE